METFRINILNPKATKLLKDLADLNLISFTKTKEESFQSVIKRIRKKASVQPPTLDEITNEVELVRSKRYGSKKG